MSRASWQRNAASLLCFQNSASRKRIRRHLALIYENSSSHDEEAHSNTRFHRRLKGRAIDNCLRIENDDVSVGPLLQTSFSTGGGCGALQYLRRHECHFANRIHESQSALLTHILSEYAGV